MEPIKQYDEVIPGNSGTQFRLSDMGEIYDAHHGEPDDPHRHDYYTVLVVEKGEGLHRIDFQSYDLSQHQVFFVAPGQVHQVEEKARPTGSVLLFSEAFLVRNGVDLHFIEDIRLFQDYGDAPPLFPVPENFQSLLGYLKEMNQWEQSPDPLKYHAIASLLKLFLIVCRSACQQPVESNTQTIHAGNSTLKEFKELVERYFKKEHQVNFYADRMAITPNHLNKVIKALIGKSAKEYIQSRLIIAAKRQLMYSEIPAKEVAYELGFEDPSNFSAFFKKCTGQSVSDFRSSLIA